MAKTRLVGDDGKVAFGSLGTLVITGTLNDGSIYIVKTVGTGPSTIPAGSEVGYPFVSDGTEDITTSGDEVYEMTPADQCDISAWSIEFSKNDIDVTTLCDTQKIYRSGKTDVSGNVSGVYTLGITDSTDGLQNNFVDIVSQAGTGGAVTVDAATAGTVYLLLYAQKDQSSGETEALYIVPATLQGFQQGVAEGENQNFESPFRITPDTEVNFSFFELTYA